MGTRKPPGHIDRLPADFEKPRTFRDAAGQHEDFGAVLTVPQMSPEEREARNAAAVRYLLRRGAEDLVDMLGLGAEPERPKPPISAVSVPCPQCAAPAGSPCVSSKTGNAVKGGHRGRYRRAQEKREAVA